MGGSLVVHAGQSVSVVKVKSEENNTAYITGFPVIS